MFINLFGGVLLPLLLVVLFFLFVSCNLFRPTLLWTIDTVWLLNVFISYFSLFVYFLLSFCFIFFLKSLCCHILSMWHLIWSHFRVPTQAKCLHPVLSRDVLAVVWRRVGHVRSRVKGDASTHFKGSSGFCSLLGFGFFVYMPHHSLAPLSVSCKLSLNICH